MTVMNNVFIMSNLNTPLGHTDCQKNLDYTEHCTWQTFAKQAWTTAGSFKYNYHTQNQETIFAWETGYFIFLKAFCSNIFQEKHQQMPQIRKSTCTCKVLQKPYTSSFAIHILLYIISSCATGTLAHILNSCATSTQLLAHIFHTLIMLNYQPLIFLLFT